MLDTCKKGVCVAGPGWTRVTRACVSQVTDDDGKPTCSICLDEIDESNPGACVTHPCRHRVCVCVCISLSLSLSLSLWMDICACEYADA